MAEQFIPQHGPDVATQDFYLARLEAIAGRPEGDFLTEDHRDKRLRQAKRAYSVLQSIEDRYRGYREERGAALSQGGELPSEPEVSQWQRRFVGYFVPGYGRTSMEGMSDEQALTESRMSNERVALFAQAAAGLEDRVARFGNEPGSHAPTLLPAIQHWYEENRAGQVTEQLVIGAASRTSAEHASQMIHKVDPLAQVTVMDLEDLALPPTNTSSGATYTFKRGNVFNLLLGWKTLLRGMFVRDSLDAVHSHLLFFGASQFRLNPAEYHELSSEGEQARGEVRFSPILESSKDEAVPIALKQIREVLRPGGAAFLTERIDGSDPAQVERVVNMLVGAGFARDAIQVITPTQRFDTRRDVDAFFASGSTHVGEFVEARRQESGYPVVVEDTDYEPTTLFVATKSTSQRRGLFGRR